MTPSRSRKADPRGAREIALDAGIVAVGAAVAILILSTLLRAAWPGSAPADDPGSTRSGQMGIAGGGAPLDAPAGRSLRSDNLIRVQILNGCGVSGVGANLASLLRGAGDIDVLEIGNADRFDYETTIVIDRIGKGTGAKRVARMLGDPPIVLQRLPSAGFDVTVIAGFDQAR
jgi:hypothetical protein